MLARLLYLGPLEGNYIQASWILLLYCIEALVVDRRNKHYVY